MSPSLYRTALGLMAAGLLTAQAHAQTDSDGPYGLEEAAIEITYAEGRSGPATVTLRPDGRAEAGQILLSLSDGRREYTLRLRPTGDGTFSARADLPAMAEIRSLRLGTGDETGRATFLMPQLREGRGGVISGTRETEGWMVRVTIFRTSGGGTITITIRG